MSSNRYVPLSTDYLAANPTGEVTMQSLLDDSERLAEEARDIMPYGFWECSYSKGYLRQAVWSCLDCGEKGVCYGCSISCHADHKLVELFVRRHFRCDCPTLPPPPSSSTRRCKLNPPNMQPAPLNEENKYDGNFRNEFCRCGRTYNPETEAEAMLQCTGCEDWFHESCLNLLAGPPPTSDPTQPHGQTNENDEDDEEAPVMIRSDTYDCLICAACVRSHPLTAAKAGSQGWLMIEPNDDGTWKVVGRRGEVTTVPPGSKRAAEDESANDVHPKRVKVEDNGSTADPNHPDGPKLAEKDGPITAQGGDAGNGSMPKWLWKGKGDVFLADGIRDKLKVELDAKTVAGLPFPLIDEETYEPPKDDDKEETFDEVSNRVIDSLPRAQTLEALHGYQNMKDKLRGLFAAHIESGTAVSKEAIESVFERLKGAKSGGGQ